MTKATNWLSAHQEAMGELREASRYLRGLANAFDVTGNEKVCSDLLWVASKIDEGEENAANAVGRHLTEGVRDAQDSIHKTFSAIFNKLGDDHE